MNIHPMLYYVLNTPFLPGGGSVTHTVFHAYSLYYHHIYYLSLTILYVYIHCCTTIYIIYTTLPWCIYTVGLYPLLYLVYVYTSTVYYRVLPMYSIYTVCICYYSAIYYYPTPGICTTCGDYVL